MGSIEMCSFHTGIAVAPIRTPVYVDRIIPVRAEVICEALVKNRIAPWGQRVSSSPKTAAAAALFENATRVHDPTDIGL